MTTEEAALSEASSPTQPAAAGATDWGRTLRAFFSPLPVALLVTAVAVSTYHIAFYAPVPKIATIDLEAVIEAKQLHFAEIVSRPGASDADREHAMALVDSVAPELNRAVAELVAECGCLVLLKNAVVGHVAPDLTARLKDKVNVGNVDVAVLRAKLRDNARGPAPSSLPAPLPR